MWSSSVERHARRYAGAVVGPVFLLGFSTSAGQILLLIFLLMLVATLIVFGVRFIPNDRVGIIEKLWSLRGSVSEGRIMAFNGQAGYEAHLLRGGIHFGKWVWQYRIHKVPLVTIPQGKIGHIYARDGEPLSPGQTLGRVVECGNFQDAESFLRGRLVKAGDEPIVVGQRGRQRSILREGVYAINLSLFFVITEDQVYHLNVDGKHELQKLVRWQEELK